MGSCMSCKAGTEAYAYTTSPAIYKRPIYPHYHSMENGGSFTTRQNENKGLAKRSAAYSRGQATLFGFKRRPATAPGAISAVDNAASATTDDVVNNGSKTSSQESLNSISPISSGKSTPRLSRPKKDVDGNNAIRTNRFGFRTPIAASVTNKVADSNCNVVSSSQVASHHNQEYRNILNAEKPRAKGGGKLPVPKIKETSIPIPTSTPDVNKVKSTRSFIPQPGGHSAEQIQTSRFTLQTTHLPKPQYPVRLASADADVKRTSKIAKTVANNSKRKVCQGSGEESSSKEGSVNDDSGIGSHQSTAMSNGETDTLHGIEILDSSPTFGFRRNRNAQKPRALEMVVNGQCFDVRDLKDDDSSADDPNVITEISVISLPRSIQKPPGSKPTQNTGIVRERTAHYQRQVTNESGFDNMHQEECLSTPSSEEFRDDGLGQEEGEEKVFQDSSRSEKSSMDKGVITPSSMEEEDWGHGEAMAEEFSSSSDDGHNNCNFSSSSLKMNIPVGSTDHLQNPRPVVLTIEDPLFAAFAAEGASSLIDDEKSPVDSLISSSPPTSSASEDDSEDQQKSLLQDDGNKRPDSIVAAGEAMMQRSTNTLSPDSPGTPTNASNSLSLSEGRDFLIDDEIADQPGLMFDDAVTGVDVTSSAGCSSLLLSVTENTTTLVDSTPKPVQRRLASSSAEGSPSPARGRRISRTGSVDTLSPCESITSDDLMLDFERSEGSAFDCTAESQRDGSGSIGGLHTLDESTVASELEEQSEDVMKEWSSLLSTHIREAGLVTSRPRILRSRAGSTPESPRSLESKPRAIGSPLRPSRQSTGSESDDGGVWLDRHTYHSICQDIVNHKTMLLKLMRHLQKDEENGLTRAETLNPFDSSLKNGLFYNLASTDGPGGDSDDSSHMNSRSPQEEVADLRRQVVFLQQQLEEEQHTVQLLQLQMTKYNNTDAASVGTSSKETCNAATQTERIRPVSAGPSLLQSLPSENNMGPLVSSTDTWGRRKQPSLGDLGSGRMMSRLPGTRSTRRTNLPTTGLAGTTDQSGIPTRKLTAPALANSALSRKISTPTMTSSSLEGYAMHLTKT